MEDATTEVLKRLRELEQLVARLQEELAEKDKLKADLLARIAAQRSTEAPKRRGRKPKV